MKFKKSLLIIFLFICLFAMASVSASDANDTAIVSEDISQMGLSDSDKVDEDNLQTSEENEALASNDYDEAIAQTDTEVLGADSATYSDLAEEISQPGNINLTHKNYTYDKGAPAITISEANKVIDGNGAVIDMNGSTIRAFYISGSGVTIKNLTIKNANYTGNGGAIYFTSSGTVTNCNFTNNTATRYGGAVYFFEEGSVSNCNFTGNTASIYGGAVYFNNDGTVSNCNFTGNTASTYGGAVYFYNDGTVSNCNFTNNKATKEYSEGGAICMYSGSVSNCNFTGNTASIYGGAITMGSGTVSNCNFTDNSAQYGGAVYFSRTGTVTNCNFADNSASQGGAIFSMGYYTTADTCIFKRNSGDNVNTVIYPPTLNVNNFTTVYGSGDKLTFDLKTNSSIPVTNGNISISVYFKDNGEWVRNYTCLSGEGWIPDLPVGSYIAFFDTEYAKFQKINRTVTITMPNVRYSINVSSVTTNNKTVNITAKSDIPKDILWDGKLLFILPNATNITANYAGNGTWWAVHTFDDYAVYQVNASYDGLNNVTVSNAKITINKADSTLTVNIELDYGDSINVTVTALGATGITAKIDNVNVTVKGYIIPISGLDVGTYTLTVTTMPDYDHVAVTKTVNIIVKKVDSKLTVGNVVFDYDGAGSTAVSFAGATGVNASVVGHHEANVNVAGNTITVSGLNVGTYNLTVTTIADANHNNITKTATITVNRLKTELTASSISTIYNINKDLVIALTDAKGNPLSGVEITVNLGGGKFTTDRNGQVKINVANLVPNTYAVKITFNGDANYDMSSKDVKVTVTKATPKLTAKAKTFKKSKKVKKYKIILKSGKKPIKRVKVTIKIGKKTFKAKTNAKGKATFKIKKLTKKGKYKAVVKFKGNKYYAKATKKVKIKIK